jgi:surface polysaccharide O-acyltransferase-like enzyme
MTSVLGFLRRRSASELAEVQGARDVFSMPRPGKERIASIETFRVIAILAVIGIHANPFATFQGFGPKHRITACLLSEAFRFAVPFFLITAGYFFGRSLQSGVKPSALLTRYARPLLFIFMTWTFLYAVIPSHLPTAVRQHGVLRAFYGQAWESLIWLKNHPFEFLWEAKGPPGAWFGHLWFFPALLFALTTLTLLLVLGLKKFIVPIVLMVAGFSYLEGLYDGTSVVFSSHFRTWGGTLLYVVLGWWLSHKGKPSIEFAIALALGGYILQVSEQVIFANLFERYPELPNYMPVGSVPFTVGIFLLALAKPNFGCDTLLPVLAQFTLAVYVSHIFILEALAPIREYFRSQVWEMSLPIVVYILAVLLGVVLARMPLANRLILRRAEAIHFARVQTKDMAPP